MTAPKVEQGILVVVDDPGWRKFRGLLPRLKRAAAAAEKAAKFRGASSLTVLLSGDAKLKTLNRDFRGKDKPTNVLSFPPRPTVTAIAAISPWPWASRAAKPGWRARAWPITRPIWSCMAYCIWPATIMSAPATPR